MERSLTVVMPAYKEANNLDKAHEGASRALKKSGLDYELFIITNTAKDGSDDGTPSIAFAISQKDHRVRHIHNKAYVGLGYKYWQGVRAASKNYIMAIPGDGEFVEDSLENIFEAVGKADIVIPFIANSKARSFKRRFVSRGFVILCNLIFGLRVRYYNGLCVNRRDLLLKIPTRCYNFTYIASILIWLIKSGASYVEVPWMIKSSVASSAFNLKSVWETLHSTLDLFWEIQVKNRNINLQI